MMNTLIRVSLSGLMATTMTALSAEDWQVIDTFEGGEAQAEWTATAAPTVDTSSGFLKIGQAEGSNTTASLRVPLPQTFSAGMFTIYFDLYLPDGPETLEHQIGFGVGSETQALRGSWNASGSRNRFQMMGPAPQALGNAYYWGTPDQPGYGTAQPDTLGPTERGVVYNVWLVYNLDEPEKGVTIHSKPGTSPMESVQSYFFEFDDEGDDDWSEVAFFAIGQGSQSNSPQGYESWDVLGAIFDNFYLSVDENMTLPPAAFKGSWDAVETFADNEPEGTWTADDDMSLTFENGTLLLNSSTANAAAALDLPLPITNGSTTIYLEMQMPSGGLNNALLALVGAEQFEAEGAARFGNNDRLITLGPDAPQAFTKWSEWTDDLFGDSQQDQWYHLWLVYDIDAKRVDVYSAPMAESGDPELPSEPAGSYALETDYAEFSKLVFGFWNLPSTGLGIDNIHQTFGRNITMPSIVREFVPEWTETEIGWVYLFTPDWGYSLYMGTVSLASMPWVYQIQEGWLYFSSSFPAEGSATNYWFYHPTNGWLFAPDNFGGYFLIVATDEWVSWQDTGS